MIQFHLYHCKDILFGPAQEKWFSQIIHTYKPYWFAWVVIYSYEAHFECHDTLMLSKSPIKWRQCPDMTIAVDWGVKHNFKQTNKYYSAIYCITFEIRG